MHIVPTRINTNTNQFLKNTDFYFNDNLPVIDDQTQPKKPLPQVPEHMSPTWNDQIYYQQYYYPPQQNYYPQYQQPLTLNSSVVGGSEWKTASIQRSDSLKIEETTVPSSYSNPLETHMEKPFEPPKQLHKKMSKQEIEHIISESEEEDSASDQLFFDQPNSSSASVPSMGDITTCTSEFQNYSRLSIVSCSLINDLKLYRRMATKTRSTDTQLAYAKYLIQISSLYNQPVSTTKQSQQMSQIRHRLLSEAGYWIEKLAKSGLPEALFIQGKWYLLGPQAQDNVIYPKAQETKALHCFIRASRGGWADAHYELANVWKKKGNPKRAVYYYDRGAKDNHTQSLYKMAKIYLRGQLKMNKDLNKGITYLLKAANMDDPESAEPAFVIACIYANEFHRIGVDRYADNKPIESLIAIDGETNDSLALKYLKKSSHFGHVDALYFMGQTFEKGMLGQSVDIWEAYQHFMKASEMNHPEAMLDLSQIYFKGIPGRLACQKDVSFKWCKRSADLGYDQAEYVLGQYYEGGVGVQANFALALEYFGKAASKGNLAAAEKLNRPVSDDPAKKNTVKHGDDVNEQVYFLKKGSQVKNNTQEHNHCSIQ